jgi:hypothetical protein
VVPRSIRVALRSRFVHGPDEMRDSRRPDRSPPGVPGGLNRVHVGCGPHNIMDDWWNVDIRMFRGVDEIADVTEPWPWHDLDYVYGEHFLEHLTLDGAIAFLSHAANALSPGGRIRLSTPSLEWAVAKYTSLSGATAGALPAAYFTNRVFYGWGHQCLYSRPLLEHVLTGAGLTDLTFHDYGDSDIPALRGAERHGGFEIVDGWPSVWIVEAVPSGAGPRVDLPPEVEMEVERHRRAGH